MRYETKKQLALAYCPATGYAASQRSITPQQERLIIEYLGEP